MPDRSPLPPWVCLNCGFWQRYFERPPSCPVCLDFRHPLPPGGWAFRPAADVALEHRTRWREVLPGVWMFEADPAIGIGPAGWLVQTEHGNVHWEGAAWTSDAALDQMERLGGVQFLGFSHAHVLGSAWRVAERFRPEVAVQEAQLPWAQALPVSWPFGTRAEWAPGLGLVHTGGHTDGHTAFHWQPRGLVFCGDAFKFILDAEGRATHVSTHKAYDAHIPLSHDDARRLPRRVRPARLRRHGDAVGGRAGGRQGRRARAAGPPRRRPPLGRPLPHPRRPAPRRRRAQRQRGRAATTIRCGCVAAPFPLPFYTARVMPVPPDPPAVARYRAALGLDEVFEFPLTPLDHTGVPVWSVAAWVDGSFQSGIGYGETDDRARIGAWGELAEGVFVHRLRAELPTRRASYRALVAAGEPAVDPLRLRLPVGTAYSADAERLWVEATRFAPGTGRDGERVWVLLEEAAAHTYNLPDGYRPLYTPITNGLGAGDTAARALQHGLLELVQRDASSAGYRAFDRGLVLDLGGVQNAETRRWIGRLQDEAGLTLMAKLAGSPLGVPVVYVVGRERDAAAMPHPLVLTGCGEGAHPDRERALQKALLEYGASRVRKRLAHGPLADLAGLVPDAYLARVREAGVAGEEGRATDAVAAWAALDAREQLRRLDGTWFRERERRPFAELPSADVPDDPEALAALLARRLADEGLDAFYVELAPPGAGVSVVKAIVPGLEVETVTYGRIGPRNLRRLLARIDAGDPIVHPDLVGLGRPPAEAQRVPLAEADEEALGGPAWIHLDLLEEALGPLYAMYREPAEHVVGLRAEREGAGEHGSGGAAVGARPTSPS